MVPDELLVGAVRKAKNSLVSTLVHEYAEKLDENYCGLCGTIHEPKTCHMIQNADNLAEYRAMLMEVTNEESVGIRVSVLARGLPVSVLMSYTA